jgi:SAM-dependent methyltransferase
MLNLNVGCGERKFGEGWVNVDCQAKYNPDVVVNAASMPMFEDGSAEIVVIHHVLEHLWGDDSTALLRESHRILVPGGRLIVTVPHVRELVKAWITGRMDDHLFFTNTYGAYMGDEADRHKWGFTPASLNDKFFAAAEWGSVVPFDWRPIPGADIVQAWWILGMEAVK